MARIEVGMQTGDEQPGSPLGGPSAGDMASGDTAIIGTATGGTARLEAADAAEPGAGWAATPGPETAPTVMQDMSQAGESEAVPAGTPEAVPAGTPEAAPAAAQAAAQEAPPGATQETAQRTTTGPRQAGRGTTIALIVALVLVVVMSGVLGAVAIRMTSNPDTPPLSQTLVRQLHTPMRFAQVTGVHQAPCPETDAIPDDKGTTCYQLVNGVTVTIVQKVEQVAERDGTYSVRIVLAPSNREEIAGLTHDSLKQQLAIVVGDKVVAAPRVAQEITQDSLSIAGFSKAQADALMILLTGAAPAPQQGQPGQPGQPGAATTTAPATTATGGGVNPGGADPGGVNPGGTSPGGANPGDANPGGANLGGTNLSGGVGGGGAGANVASRTGSAASPMGSQVVSAGQDVGGAHRFTTCKQATDAGYGPYTKGIHPEYAWYADVDQDGVACDRDDL
jgi:Excalibur calcium-binding domain